MPEATPMAPDFQTLAEQSRQLRAQAQQAQVQQRQVLSRMKALLIGVLQRYHQAFEGLKDLSEEAVRVPDAYDDLEHWHVQDGWLEAVFGYSFRSEHNSYEVRLPTRYLGENGHAQIEADAQALRQQAQEQELRDQAEQEEGLRALFESLKSRFEPQVETVETAGATPATPATRAPGDRAPLPLGEPTC